MNEYKFNLFYNNGSNSFQEIMNKIFSNYFKQKLESEEL
jgi:hypothetical protein